MKKRIITAVFSLLLLASLVIVPISAENKTAEEIAAKAVEITRSFEGVYSSVCLDDCGAVSVGYLQWHASRALLLVRSVVEANPTNAKKILSTALYNEITKSTTSWNERILTSAEGDQISKLLDTTEGHDAEDALAKSDVLGYVRHGLSLGITDPITLVYFADTENQCGAGGSARIAKAAAALVNGVYSDITVDVLHKAALSDGAAGKYPVRRSKAYNACLLIPWGTVSLSYNYEIWEVKKSWTLRSGPTTDYELLGSVYDGTQMVILEKYAEDEYTWGRTYMGWFCIQYCNYVSGSIPTPVLFDTDGGAVKESGKTFTLTVDGVNTSRKSNMLVVYNGEYGTKTSTNQWGAEVTVSADGLVLSAPTYGSCNLSIPEDGFAISGLGTGYDKMYSAIKKGYYAHFDIANNKITVYENKNDYLLAHFKQKLGKEYGTLPQVVKEGVAFDDWYSGNSIVTSKTLGSSHLVTILKAKWQSIPDIPVSFGANGGSIHYQASETALSGFNVPLATNGLVLYNSLNRTKTTGTSGDVCEVIVSSGGTVAQVLTRGLCNSAIPEGGYILSGSGTIATWLSSNLHSGSFIVIDGTKIKAYESESNYLLAGKSKTVSNGEAYGVLPVPTKADNVFAGWTLADGTSITSGTKVSTSNAVNLSAKWKKLSSPLVTATAGGINTPASDSLIIYAGCATTKTTGKCSEAVVDCFGKIISVSHNGNTAVPEGATVVSGSGAASVFVDTYLQVGRYVKINGTEISVYN